MADGNQDCSSSNPTGTVVRDHTPADTHETNREEVSDQSPNLSKKALARARKRQKLAEEKASGEAQRSGDQHDEEGLKAVHTAVPEASHALQHIATAQLPERPVVVSSTFPSHLGPDDRPDPWQREVPPHKERSSRTPRATSPPRASAMNPARKRMLDEANVCGDGDRCHNSMQRKRVAWIDRDGDVACIDGDRDQGFAMAGRTTSASDYSHHMPCASIITFDRSKHEEIRQREGQLLGQVQMMSLALAQANQEKQALQATLFMANAAIASLEAQQGSTHLMAGHTVNAKPTAQDAPPTARDKQGARADESSSDAMTKKQRRELLEAKLALAKAHRRIEELELSNDRLKCDNARLREELGVFRHI